MPPLAWPLGGLFPGRGVASETFPQANACRSYDCIPFIARDQRDKAYSTLDDRFQFTQPLRVERDVIFESAISCSIDRREGEADVDDAVYPRSAPGPASEQPQFTNGRVSLGPRDQASLTVQWQSDSNIVGHAS